MVFDEKSDRKIDYFFEQANNCKVYIIANSNEMANTLGITQNVSAQDWFQPVVESTHLKTA
jgi:hypothetical protein